MTKAFLLISYALVLNLSGVTPYAGQNRSGTGETSLSSGTGETRLSSGIFQTCLSTHVFNDCNRSGYITFGFNAISGLSADKK